MTRSHGRAVGTYILLKYIRNQSCQNVYFVGLLSQSVLPLFRMIVMSSEDFLTIPRISLKVFFWL